MALVLPSLAYDIQMLDRPADRHEGKGWVYGLPPGITEAEWPLDPVTGYPLMHGFTLLLPDEYRVHGEDIVALSFFATAPDHNDGGAIFDESLRDAVLARPCHPRLHRMTDILDYQYALILLTEAEFEGPLRPPPQPLPAATASVPRWLEVGGAAAYFETGHDKLVRRLFASPPREEHDENRAISWTPRKADPNAGKAPRDKYGTGTPSGYLCHYYYEGAPSAANFRLHDWAKDHAVNHIGGTMRPCQAVPDMSPFYIEFEEYFGGYNFGTGNAQLDFKNMKFDWACG